MKNQRTFFSFFLTLCIVGLSYAQSSAVSGTVSDADGPLPGATCCDSKPTYETTNMSSPAA